jgi:hypothetical protein
MDQMPHTIFVENGNGRQIFASLAFLNIAEEVILVYGRGCI